MTVAELLQRAGVVHDAAEVPDAGPLFSTTCRGVTHDSRQVQAGSVFVALRGRKSDGAVFAAQALAAGASAVVAEQQPDAQVHAPWVVVQDARAALASLSAEFFGHPSRQMRVVGITGTNGKTTTAYLLSSMLESAGLRCGLLGTVVYRLGGREVVATRTTPEAPDLQALLRQMVDGGCRACVMEVSSHALALRRADATCFAAGIFTNLTRDHLDFHANMEEYFAAKRRLFEMLPAGAPAVVNLDDPRAAGITAVVARAVTYAVNRAADVTPGPLAFSLDGLTFDARTPGGTVRVRSHLVGRPNVYNILAAVAAASALDVPLEAIERGISNLACVPGRFERVSSTGDDTDDALRNLLETARPLAPRRLITVFGAGGERDRTKRPLMGMVAARLSDMVVITSDNPRTEDPLRIIEEVHRGAEPETRQRSVMVQTIVDRRQAIRTAIGQAAPGDLVLIAGKGHEKLQEIDGESMPFDDVLVAREALEARRLRLKVG
jgi:UDP-N-acetylmuramoyl-L-alanyl-D-glutamate--2,6-diaminopimelate ligase